MRRALIIAAVLAVAVPAAAADIAGRYQGTGRGQSTLLDLTQTGGVLEGRFRFPDGAEGTLLGRPDGSGASGTVTIPGVGQALFQAAATPDGLRLRIIEPGRVTTAVFVRAAPADAAQPQAEAASPLSSVTFFVEENGVAVGPYSAAQLAEKLRRGAVAADQRVRRSDRQAWSDFASVPELQAIVPQIASRALKPAAVGEATEPAAGQSDPSDEDLLREAARELAAAGNPGATGEARDAAAACLLRTFDPLAPPDRRQFLFDIRSGPAPGGGRALAKSFPGLDRALAGLEPRYPGLGAAIDACL